MALGLGGLALAETPSQALPPYLTLHLPLATGVLARVGPTPEVVGDSPGEWLRGEGQGALRLASEVLDGHGRVVHAPPSARLLLPAKGVLVNAQGAVSFWIRAPRVKDPQAHDFPVLLRLVNSGGGTWDLAVRETPYAPGEKKLTGSEAAALAEQSSRVELDALTWGNSREEKGEPPDLDEAAPPGATLQCRIDMQLWPEGKATLTLVGEAHQRQAQEWHHVLWTWRSLHHDLYIDGQRVGGDAPPNRISRLAPITLDAARLELLACSADVRDLRLYSRWLPPEHARLLATTNATGELPALPPVRVWTDWGYSTGRSVIFVDAGGVNGAAYAEVRCVAAGQDAPVSRQRMPTLPDGLGEAVSRPFEPKPFPPGNYHYEAVVYDAAGVEVGRGHSAVWTCEKKPWPFLGFEGGRSETAKVRVIPPFTPVVVKADTVSVVLREHGVGRQGFFTNVVAAGKELLAGPIRLDVVAGGQPLAFTEGPGLGAIQGGQTYADWRAETRTPQGHSLSVDAHLEYDGVTRFDVTLSPATTLAVDRVELVIPYRQETVRLCHSGLAFWFGAIERGADGVWSCRAINWAGPGGERERRQGVLFDSFDKALGLFPPPVRTAYTPYMHIGNDHRGLAWFVDNDQNWIHDPSIPPLEFVARGDAPFLRLNLVAQASVLNQPVTWSFYLLANPFKPLPPKWRAWGVGTQQRSNKLLKQADHLFWWHWGEYAGGFRPYPGPAVSYDEKAGAPEAGQQVKPAGGTYDDWRDKFKNDDVRHLPFINFGTPGGFPGFTPDCMVYPYTWKLHNNQPHRDYVAYWLDRCVRDIGIDGVYIDEPYSEPYSYNVLAGDAPYIRPDGTRSIGYRYMEGRAYIRRLKQLFTDHGIDYSIWLHNTNYRALPVMTFADIGMDGEHPSIWVPEFDRYHSFYNPAQSRGYIAGAAYGFVGAQMFHANTNPKGADAFARLYRKCRTYLAVTLPNGVLPMSTTFSGELDRIQNINAAFGLAVQEPEELTAEQWAERYPGISIVPAPMSLTALLLPQSGRTLLYVGAPVGPATNALVITGNLTPLGEGKPDVHLWDAENGASLRVNGQWRLAVPPEDFACVWIEGRDSPQPDRPAGVLLGVSFDRSMEADAGGGLLPVATANGAPLPAPVAGRSGGGLAVSGASPALAYPVVPSWAAGSVQFDLKAERASTQPLTLLRLEHHLDCELQIASRKDVAGLLLTVRETPLVLPVPATAYVDGNPPAVARTAFGKLSAAGPEGWRRVILTWQAGRYRLYCDGVEIAAILDPAAPRLRDALAPVRGVRFGDGARGGGGAVLDSIRVYDWTLAPADVRAAWNAAPDVPVVLKANNQEAFTVWYDHRAHGGLRAGAAFGRHPASTQVTHVRFSLLDAHADGGKPLAVGEAVPWCGNAWSSLAMKTAEQFSSVAADFGEKVEKDVQAYRLRVELIQRRAKEAGGDKILASQEQKIELDPFSGMEGGLPEW